MISTVILLTLLLSHVGVVLSQACTSAVQGLGGVRSLFIVFTANG